MIGVNRLLRTIRLALLSSYIAGERPVSIMLISKEPESGKTEIIEKFSAIPKIKVVTDTTAFGIWRDFHKPIARGEINHLLFPDFLTALSRRSTIDSLITTLNPLIEEGVAEIHTGFLPPIKIQSPRPIGIITAMIKAPFDCYREEWIKNGFTSRLVLVTYSYSDGTKRSILNSIVEGKYKEERKVNLKLPSEPVPIYCSKAIGVELRMLCRQVLASDRSIAPHGFRMLKHLIVMAKASALLFGRDEVTQEDLDNLEDISTHINERYTEI